MTAGLQAGHRLIEHSEKMIEPGTEALSCKMGLVPQPRQVQQRAGMPCHVSGQTAMP